jgi:hypothetical protein
MVGMLCQYSLVTRYRRLGLIVHRQTLGLVEIARIAPRAGSRTGGFSGRHGESFGRVVWQNRLAGLTLWQCKRDFADCDSTK